MDSSGIKVRIFDMENGLREYEDIKIIRIISKDYNLNANHLYLIKFNDKITLSKYVLKSNYFIFFENNKKHKATINQVNVLGILEGIIRNY
mgnify:CR=1 FL=1